MKERTPKFLPLTMAGLIIINITTILELQHRPAAPSAWTLDQMTQIATLTAQSADTQATLNDVRAELHDLDVCKSSISKALPMGQFKQEEGQ